MVMFERENWKEFRTLDGLCRMAGVSRDKMATVVAKELVDNALDESDDVTVDMLKDNVGFFVQDNGPGIDPEKVADLFSIKRSYRSSKFLRLPTRGALGNGLRVVAGAVLCTKGRLTVSTRGQVMELVPKDDGSTEKTVIGEYKGKGTRVEVQLGSDVGVLSKSTLWMARHAIAFKGGIQYKGKTNGYWYTSRDLFELCDAIDDKEMTVRAFSKKYFEGGDNRDIISGFKGKKVSEITLDDAKVLLTGLRHPSKPVKPGRLGKYDNPDLENIIGPYYAKAEGTFKSTTNLESIEIPYIVEAWAKILNDEGSDSIEVLVNRTPITGDVAVSHYKTNLFISGCNLERRRGRSFLIKVGKKPVLVYIGITTPYMPKTSEGKSPDLLYFRSDIEKVIKKAVKKATLAANASTIKSESHKKIVRANLKDAIQKTSGKGQYKFTQRMLYYAMREIVAKAGTKGLTYQNFTKIISNYENEIGHDLPGMIRDDRGSVYHPHTHETMPLGSVTVEGYQPPDWTFNKVLYIEKEGFFQILQDEMWPERHDCALLTSKGQATRAAKDLIDGLKDSKENVIVFCIHDGDAAGTMIYQALNDETVARGKRNIEVINLGLEPWEGIEMELQPEPVKYEKVQPVARYVKDESEDESEDWADWLQTNRIELNAMTTPQFLEWLDNKMAEYDQGKVIPPENVIESELEKKVMTNLTQKIRDKILKEQHAEDRIKEEFEKLKPTINEEAQELVNSIKSELNDEPTQSWKDPVARVAIEILDDTVTT